MPQAPKKGSPKNELIHIGHHDHIVKDGVRGKLGVGTRTPEARLSVSENDQTLNVNPHAAGVDLHSTGSLASLYQTDFTICQGDMGSAEAKLAIDRGGNVGIAGAAQAGDRLRIMGATADTTASALNVVDSTGKGLLLVKNDGSVDIGTGVSPSAAKLNVAGVSQFRGNVGVGASPSDAKFKVGGGSHFTGNVGIGAAPSTEGLRVQGRSQFIGNVGVGGAPSTAKLKVTGVSHFTENVSVGVSPSDAKFKVGGVSHFTGNVGIGTVPSTEKLRVQGKSQFIGNVGVGGAPSTAKLKVAGVSHFTDSVGVGVSPSDAKFKVGGMSHFTGSVGIGLAPPDTEAFKVKGESHFIGNVGVGVSPSDAKFKVAGVSHFTNNVGIGTPPSDDADLRFDVDGDVRMSGGLRISGDLNVGGTLSDHTSRIGILETTSTSHGAGIDSLKRIGAQHNTRISSLETAEDEHAGQISSLVANKVNKGGGTITGSLVVEGNVRIGRSGPGEKLSVGGAIESTSGGFKFPDGTIQTSAVTLGPGASSNEATGDFSFACGSKAIATHERSLVFNASGGELKSTASNQVLFKCERGLGIGVDRPSAQLDVAGDIHASGNIVLGGASASRGADSRSPVSVAAETAKSINPEVALLSPMDSITHMLRSVETGVLGSLDLTCGEI